MEPLDRGTLAGAGTDGASASSSRPCSVEVSPTATSKSHARRPGAVAAAHGVHDNGRRQRRPPSALVGHCGRVTNPSSLRALVTTCTSPKTHIDARVNDQGIPPTALSRGRLGKETLARWKPLESRLHDVGTHRRPRRGPPGASAGGRVSRDLQGPQPSSHCTLLRTAAPCRVPDGPKAAPVWLSMMTPLGEHSGHLRSLSFCGWQTAPTQSTPVSRIS